ncbi:MAG: hypothetical protein LBJ94_00800 [Puniceicoccales bacterium]|jgi:hypothetical protein|nr:hypothetical protein [Puniceicoccales bacterium]
MVEVSSVQLILPSDLRIQDSEGGGVVFPVGSKGEVGASKFCGHLIRLSSNGYIGNIGKAKYIDRSLKIRSVLAKRPISNSVDIASNISQLRKSLVKAFAQLGGNANVGRLCEYECKLRTMFAPIFMTRGESAKELGKIRSFVDELLAKMPDQKSVKQICSQYNHILEHSGAMVLFGILRSALNEAKCEKLEA